MGMETMSALSLPFRSMVAIVISAIWWDLRASLWAQVSRGPHPPVLLTCTDPVGQG